MGLDPLSIGVGIATNLATDILKHYTQYLEGTLIRRGLKAIGLPEQTQEDHLRQVLEKALRLYFTQYPAYNISGVIDFFRDPVTVQQLGNYIFDRHPIDQQIIEAALARHHQQDSLSRLVLQQGGGQLERIVSDFLACYRQVLNEQTDVGERVLFLTVLEATDTVIAEMRTSEEHLKAFLTEALQAQSSAIPILSSEQVVKAIEAFIQAPTWKESRSIVEAQQDVLLTDTAEQIFNTLLKQNSDDERVNNLLQEHHNLLLRCRSEGIESAFANYILIEDIQHLLDESERLTSQYDFPRKVEIYREALERIDRSTYPQLWAFLHASLATSLARDPWERLENLEQATLHFQQALTVYTPQIFPEEWAQVQFELGSLAYLGYVLTQSSQDLHQAIFHYTDALQVYTREAFPEQWTMTMNNLAIAYKSLAIGDRASNLNNAIQIWQQIISSLPPSPKRLYYMNNLSEGMVERYRFHGNETDVEEAIKLSQQVVEHTPSESPNLPTYLNNLVSMLRMRYNVSGDRTDLERAIQLAERRLGLFELQGNIMGSASSYYQLGTLAQDQGNYAEAEPLYKRALAIDEEVYGPEHPSTASGLDSLAGLYHAQGKYREAELLHQRALRIWDQHLGLEHSQHAQAAIGDYNAQVSEGGNAIVNIHTPERYVNVCMVRQEDRRIVPKTTDLETRRTYDLRLDIGPILDESVVQNAEQYPFPAHLLPLTNVGYWLEVIVVSDDFVVPLRQYHLFLPRLGPSWVCNCPPGKDHQCSGNERQPYLFIPIQTSELPQVARLRIAIYYQRNLIQSQLLTAKITEIEQVGAGHSSIIDYTLTADLYDLSFLPPRTLHILTNDNADGSHRLVINGEGDDILAFHVTEGQIQVTVDAAREALRNVHFEEYGGTLGSRRQRHNLLDGNNAKTKEAFMKDLARLAPLGWKLWTLLLNDRLGWRKKLLAPATIQVSRTLSSTLAFPWALVYDIPLASQGPYKVCPLLENWDGNKGLIDLSVSCCPHESTHGLKNTLCPFGFWGFRHVIEQPASMPSGRNLPMVIHLTNHPPALVAGLSQALEKDQTAKHLQAMKQQLTLFTVQDHTSLQDIITALAVPVEMVYFYCHGGREPLAGTSQHTPYLQVGEDERFQPSDITTWRVADWPDHHWEQTSPLVFINGCHTAELTPELLVNFVDAFSTAYAAGVIGTEISVEQDIAAEAAEHFFNAFQQNKTVGQALQQMRLHFLAKGNLLGLAYTPYCSANLRL